MSVVSIRLSDNLLNDLDTRAKALHIPRTEYIRKAIEHMNEETLKQERKQQLIQASLRVRNQSMKINKEFSKIERDPDNETG